MDRVLEIGGFAAGYCGRLFARADADVVRADPGMPTPGWVSKRASDLFLHAGKRHVSTREPALLAELAGAADVVVCEAPDADTLDALGFDAWTTAVKVALTPFGRTGPKRNWRAAPSVILAMGGYTNVMGDPERPPLSLPGHYLEFQAGTLAYVGANACRLAQQRNVIDISLLETVMALSQFTTVRWHCAGELRTRHGSDFWFVVPSNLFACADGWVYINIVPDFWDAFTVFLDRPELLLDARFTTNDNRMAHRDALHAITAEAIAGFSKKMLEMRAVECRIPLGVVQTFSEVLEDTHLDERDFWETVVDERGLAVRSPRLPFRFDGNPPPQLKLQPATPSDG